MHQDVVEMAVVKLTQQLSASVDALHEREAAWDLERQVGRY